MVHLIISFDMDADVILFNYKNRLYLLGSRKKTLTLVLIIQYCERWVKNCYIVMYMHVNRLKDMRIFFFDFCVF